MAREPYTNPLAEAAYQGARHAMLQGKTYLAVAEAAAKAVQDAMQEQMSAQGLPNPAIMRPAAAAEFFADIRNVVANHDSMEGSVAWEWTTADHIPPGTLAVQGAYRVGNQTGQGGMVLINADTYKMPEPEPVPPDDIPW